MRASEDDVYMLIQDAIRECREYARPGGGLLCYKYGDQYIDFFGVLRRLECALYMDANATELIEMVTSRKIFPSYWMGRNTKLTDVALQLNNEINKSIAHQMIGLGEVIREVMDIDWSLEWVFPHFDREALPEKSGVYLAVRHSEIMYIGQTNNFRRRLSGRHHALWTKVYLVGLVSGKFNRLEVERKFIHQFRPQLNNQFPS